MECMHLFDIFNINSDFIIWRFKVVIDLYLLMEILEWLLMCVVCWGCERKILKLKNVIDPYLLIEIIE